MILLVFLFKMIHSFETGVILNHENYIIQIIFYQVLRSVINRLHNLYNKSVETVYLQNSFVK